jgi:[protein-PII] uridylyltransferase
MLDARTLAGDRGLVDQVRGEVIRRVARRPQRLLEQLLQADEERHARTGTPTETLEPDLKLGAGGLRDIQMIGWVSKRHFATERLQELVERRSEEHTSELQSR